MKKIRKEAIDGTIGNQYFSNPDKKVRLVRHCFVRGELGKKVTIRGVGSCRGSAIRDVELSRVYSTMTAVDLSTDHEGLCCIVSSQLHGITVVGPFNGPAMKAFAASSLLIHIASQQLDLSEDHHECLSCVSSRPFGAKSRRE